MAISISARWKCTGPTPLPGPGLPRRPHSHIGAERSHDGRPATEAYEAAEAQWETIWPALAGCRDKIISWAQREVDGLRLSTSHFAHGSLTVSTTISFPECPQIVGHAFLRRYLTDQVEQLGLRQVEWVPMNVVDKEDGKTMYRSKKEFAERMFQSHRAEVWPSTKDGIWECTRCGQKDNRAQNFAALHPNAHDKDPRTRCELCSRLRGDCETARVVSEAAVTAYHLRNDALSSKTESVGSWCSGITSALHAEGLGFEPRRVQ